MLKCRACLDKGLKWLGANIFSNEAGVYIYCVRCETFMARTPPLAIDMACDLCREGVEHDHEEFSPREQENQHA